MLGQTIRCRLRRYYAPSFSSSNYYTNNDYCVNTCGSTQLVDSTAINSSKNSNRSSSSRSITVTNTSTIQVMQQQQLEQGRRTTQYRSYKYSTINTNIHKIQSCEYSTNSNNYKNKPNKSQYIKSKYFTSTSTGTSTDTTSTNTTTSSTTTIKSSSSSDKNDKKLDDTEQKKVNTNNNDNTTNNESTTNNKGEELYQQYITILEKIEQMKEDKERIKSEKMFNAWQRVTDKSNNNKIQKELQEQQQAQQQDLETSTKESDLDLESSTITTKQQIATKTDNKNTNSRNTNNNLGIIVTKTLAKFTKEEIEQKDNDTKIIQKLLQQANIVLQKAALHYNHSKSLVILGNEQIQLAQEQQIQLQQETNSNNTTSSPNTTTIIVNECIQKGFEYYRNSQSSEGLYNLAHTLWTGIPGSTKVDDNNNDSTTVEDEEWIMKPNKQEAMKVFLEAATKYNDCDAMYFLGVEMLSTDNDNNEHNDDTNNNTNDITVQENEEQETNTLQRRQEGLQWVKKAIELSNHGGAMYYLTLLYLNGDQQLNIKPCTDIEFQRLLEYSIKSNTAVADAYYLRGYCYNTGQHGYTIQYENALNDYITCATMGHADGAVNAGVILFNGNNSTKYGPIIPNNYQRAFEYYQLGGELGSIDGWRNVVSCYMNGHGVPQSIDMAKYIAKTMLLSESESEESDNDEVEEFNFDNDNNNENNK